MSRWHRVLVLVGGVMTSGGLGACGDGTSPVDTPATPTTTFVAVEPPAGLDWSAAGVVSRDGTVVVGLAGLEPANSLAIFRWDLSRAANDRLQWLEPPQLNRDPQALFNVFAIRMSADGKSLLASQERANSAALFRWNESAGMTDLGPVPGRGLALTHFDVSDDGTFASGTDGPQAFRWSDTEGRVALGQLPGDVGNEALAISADGQVIAGNSVIVADRQSRVFRWSAAGGIAAIDALPDSRTCETQTLLSDDGRVLFGVCIPATTGKGDQFFRWTEAAGTEPIAVTDLPYAMITPWSTNVDGTTAVGSFIQAMPPLPNAAPAVRQAVFRWTARSGVFQFAPPPGFVDCPFVHAATGDGTTVVGGCNDGPGTGDGTKTLTALVKWDASGAPVVLERPAGFEKATALSVSADGHVVSGSVETTTSASTTRNDTAVMWDDRRAGPVLVTDLLVEQGVPAAQLEGLRLRTARMSPDGHTLAGDAADAAGRRLAWVARLAQ